LWNYRPKMIIFIIPKMEREYEREIVWGINGKERRKERLLRGEDIWSMLLHIFKDSIINPTKHRKRAKETGGNESILERVNVCEGHYMHFWNCHNEVPSDY
jgi:hypothetical protein